MDIVSSLILDWLWQRTMTIFPQQLWYGLKNCRFNPWVKPRFTHLDYQGKEASSLQWLVELKQSIKVWRSWQHQATLFFLPFFNIIMRFKWLIGAFVAQLVERSLGKTEVSGSNPDKGSSLTIINVARILKWSTRAVCKTAGSAYVGSNPTPGTSAPLAQLVRAPVL